jgi:hypothetical protein
MGDPLRKTGVPRITAYFQNMNPSRLTDAQWREFRARMEELAEASARSPEREVNKAELAEMLLLLVDRIDQLEKRLSA